VAPLRLLLVDTCVLIDFVDADASVLTLTARHVGELYVATPVLEEARNIDSAMAASFGITLFEPTFQMVVEAAAGRGRLSFQDRLCLAIAKAHGWILVSNDKRLRAACASEGVATMWAFELLALLVAERALSPIAAREIALKIAAANKRIGPEILQRFLKNIGVGD
jgi:predicted nucleic acid-binding protein